MNIANIWSNCSPTYRIVANCLARHGQIPKWSDYKETILELGCGDGGITKKLLYPFLKDHLRKLVAIDKDREMIKVAKERNRIVNVEYHVMNIMEERTIQEFENQFDKIFTFLAVHWVPDNRSLFLNLHKMLKKDGQIFVATLSDNFLRRSYVKQRRKGTWSKYLPDRQPFVDYTNNPEEHFKNLLQSVGFKVDFLKSNKEFYTMDQCKEFIHALVYMSGDFQKIPAELREDYIMDHYINCREEFIYLGKPNIYDVPIELMVSVASKVKI